MHGNKFINRDGQDAATIFDNRSLGKDYRTLVPFLVEGLRILDVGCGTGSITRDIANIIGPDGRITGIDNTESFIRSGKTQHGDVSNLDLILSDFFEFETEEKFDLIIAARTLQWMSRVDEALVRMKGMLKPGGHISILDYNHKKIEWNPAPPGSMLRFYDTFLKWREDAGMNNEIADDLPGLLEKAGFKNIEKLNSDEQYQRGTPGFESHLGIWSKVAGSRQMVEEGYLDEDERLRAIQDYNAWIKSDAMSMTMKLNEVRGSI